MRVGPVMFLLSFGIGVAAVAPAQDATASQVENPHKVFPKNWVRGYVEGAVAPPHNEPDLNRCQADSGQFGGSSAPCSAFARYVWSGYVELQPLGTSQLRRLFVFIEPHLFLGRNVPQFQYSISATPMAFERALGVGIELPKHFEIRLTRHQVDWIGRYSQQLGIADLGPNGPLGHYATVSVRWSFGGYGRR
jgi:hypothetical protein